MTDIELPHRDCNRCGHRWVLRTESEPAVCPKCKSPYWNRKRLRTLRDSRKAKRYDTDTVDPATLLDADTVLTDVVSDTDVPKNSGAPPPADGLDKDTDTVTVIHSEGYIRTAADISDTLPDLEKPSESDGIENSEKKIAPQIGDDTDDLLIISDGEKIATVSKSDVSKAVKDIGAPDQGSQDDLDRLKVELFDAVGVLPLSPDDADPPKGYWNCPHCNALNETENKTGVCSSCGKLVDPQDGN